MVYGWFFSCIEFDGLWLFCSCIMSLMVYGGFAHVFVSLMVYGWFFSCIVSLMVYGCFAHVL
jgi:hypothetical protein